MKRKDELRVLLRGEFSTMVSSWTEYLCLQRSGAKVIVSSRGYEVLAELREFAVDSEDDTFEYKLPATIDGKTVVGIEDGQYVIGGELVPQDDDAEITLEAGSIEEAREWLEGREWHTRPGFDRAWREIQTALGRG